MPYAKRYPNGSNKFFKISATAVVLLIAAPATAQEPFSKSQGPGLVYDRALLIQHTVDTHWHSLTQILLSGLTNSTDPDQIEGFKAMNAGLDDILRPAEDDVKKLGGLSGVGKLKFSITVTSYLKVKPMASSVVDAIERGDPQAALEIYTSSAVPTYEVALNGLSIARELQFEN